MVFYVLRRLLLLVPVLLGVSVIAFVLIRLIPGDPVVVILGQDYTPEGATILRHQLGFDQPLIIQYLDWITQILHGDLGNSIYPFGGVQFKGDRVIDVVAQRLPTTLLLATGATVLSVLVGIPIGMIAAIRRGSRLDSALRILAMAGISMPVFWFGLLLIMLFAVYWHLLPASGDPGTGGPTALILPIGALALSQVALVSRMARAAMLDALGQDYIRTARAKGLPPRVINVRHALPNALIPVITVVGFQLGSLLSGAVLTETVFNMPGLGRLLVQSVDRRDYPMIEASMLVIAVLFVLANLAVDILYAIVDPRIVSDAG